MLAAHPSCVSLAFKNENYTMAGGDMRNGCLSFAEQWHPLFKPHARNHCTPLLPANFLIPQPQDIYTSMTYSAKRASLGASAPRHVCEHDLLSKEDQLGRFRLNLRQECCLLACASSSVIRARHHHVFNRCARNRGMFLEIRHCDYVSMYAITKGSVRKRVKL